MFNKESNSLILFKEITGIYQSRKVKANDGRCTSEIKCWVAMAKAAFIKKKALFTSTLDLEFEEEASEVLHLERSFIWC